MKSAIVLVASFGLCLVACDKQTPTQKETKDVIKQTVKAAPTIQYFEPAGNMETQLANFKKYVGHSNLIMVKVTDKEILVEGQSVLKLDAQGNIPADKLMSLLIPDLRKAITAVAKARATDKSAFVMGVHVDNKTPMKLLRHLYYSMNQADLSPKGSSVILMGASGVRSVLLTERVGDEPVAMKITTQALVVGPPKTVKLRHKVFLSIDNKGMTVAYNTGEYTEDEKYVKLPPIKGCPADGPTICNRGQKDATALLKALSTAKGDAWNTAMMALIQVYDFRSLYNTMVELKAKKSDLDIVMVSLEPEMPVDLLGHIASHVRFVRPDAGQDGKIADDKAYYLKRYANTTTDKCYQGDTKKCLFPFVGLSLVR